MISPPKRILVVAYDLGVRQSLLLLLKSEGYDSEAVSSDDDAFKLLERRQFDLVLLGRNTDSGIHIGRRLRDEYQSFLTLKIDNVNDEDVSRVTDSVPKYVGGLL